MTIEDSKKYALVNIGCIECGVSSKLVGMFNDKEFAEKLAKQLDDKFKWRNGGDNNFEVFEVGELNKIDEEYL
jgi:hypothetical protein